MRLQKDLRNPIFFSFALQSVLTGLFMIYFVNLAQCQNLSGPRPTLAASGTYSISGCVFEQDRKTGLDGVTITFGIVCPKCDSLNQPVPPEQLTTDADGCWSQSGFIPGLTYRVASSKSGYNFDSPYAEFSSVKKINFNSTLSIIFPNGATSSYPQNLLIGSEVTIRWSSGGLGGNVRIELSRDGSLHWETLFLEIPNSGKVLWSVTGPRTRNAILKITLLNGTAKPIRSSSSFDISEAQVITNLSVPFVHQIHDAWPGFRGQWACGATSAVMIAAFYERLPRIVSLNISPYGYHLSNKGSSPEDDSTRMPVCTNINVEKVPTGPYAFGAYGYIHQFYEGMKAGLAKAKLAVDYFEHLKLESKSFDADLEQKIIDSLDREHPVLVSTNLAGGHIVVIKGYTSDGYYIVHDPWKGENLLFSWNELFADNKWIVTAEAFKISGRITLKGTGLESVTVALTGDSSATTITDSDGNYQFTNLANGFYTIIPSKTSYTFSPPSRPGSVNNAAVTGQDFTVTQANNSFHLPDTGQTTCYDMAGNVMTCPLPGDPLAQDGSYNINPLSYTDNGNSTVTDNNTGLMWQQTDDGNMYNWYQASGTYDSTFNPSSQNVCGSLSLGGNSDWRLPTMKELTTIVDYSILSPGPTINVTYFPITKSSIYWASNTSYCSGEPGSASFEMGYVDYIGSKNFNFYVRCVRGGGYPVQSLVDNADGTVTDSSTGLTWQQGESGSMTWEAALSLCESSNLANKTDWRMPNIKELASLAEYVGCPSINTAFFPGTQDSPYWSSTTEVYTPSIAWYVNFADGRISTGNYKSAYPYNVRCVCGGTVNPNQSPVISLVTPATCPYTGGSTTVTCNASDPDGDPLTYSWTATDGIISGSGPTITWIAPNAPAGSTYTVTCTVLDGRGGSDLKGVSIFICGEGPT